MAGTHHKRDRRQVAYALLTISDTRTEADDTSGRALRERLDADGHRLVHYEILPDEPADVRSAVERLVRREDVEAVLLDGGTGVAPRDNTYEAISGLLTKRIDGFGELFRMLSWEEVGAMAMVSRAVAGLAGDTVVFSVPGSTAACRLAADKLIAPALGHLVGLARSGSTDGGGQ